MRVVAGSARGRRLVAPPGREVRPTTDRVRESVFNALGSLGMVEGARLLDLFAGSGALGIEALSRGASHVAFVERDRAARQAIDTNLAATDLADRATITAQEAKAFVAGSTETFDVVLLDPPYDYEGWSALLTAVAPLIAPGGLVVIESSVTFEPPPGWGIERAKRYGGTLVTFARPPSPSEPR
jgi:16S rRNA (guanine966-N2)-methyltransferase